MSKCEFVFDSNTRCHIIDCSCDGDNYINRSARIREIKNTEEWIKQNKIGE